MMPKVRAPIRAVQWVIEKNPNRAGDGDTGGSTGGDNTGGSTGGGGTGGAGVPTPEVPAGAIMEEKATPANGAGGGGGSSRIHKPS